MRLQQVPGLRTYYLAATLARVGDEMVAFALVLLVLDRTGSPGLAGVTGAAYALPAVVTGPVLGAWLDRTTHRRLALGLSQTVLGATMLMMLAVVGQTSNWLTPALAVIAGATLPMVSGGFTSMLPLFVPKPLLPRANSFEAVSFSTATIAGPATAATIAAVVSVEAAVVTIAVIATASLIAIGRLPVLAPVRGDDPEPFGRAVTGGLVHLFRSPPLRATTIASTLALGMASVLLLTLPLHVETLGAPREASGYVWTAIEIGTVVAALLSTRWLSRFRPEYVVLVSVAAYGVAMMTWPLASSMAVLLILAPLTGLLSGAMMPAMLTARQRYSPRELQGRVNTTAASLRIGVMALGQAVGGALVPHLGTRAMLVAIATGLVAASAVAFVARGGRTPATEDLVTQAP